MKFATKRELLKHLGKNENDRKLVDRLIIKGRVYKEGGMYVLIEGDIDNVSLIHEVERLKKEIKNLNETISDLNATVSDLEYQIEHSNGGDRGMAEKIYTYLVYQQHLHIDKSEFMEMLGF